MLYLTPRIAEAGKVHWCKPFCKIKDIINMRDEALNACVLHVTEQLLFACMYVWKKKKVNSSKARGKEHSHAVAGLNIHWSINHEEKSCLCLLSCIYSALCVYTRYTCIQIRRWLWGWGCGVVYIPLRGLRASTGQCDFRPPRLHTQ